MDRFYSHSASKQARPDKAGVALLSSLGMLVLFLMLGTAYITYMSTEFEQTKYEIKDLRVRQLAQSGAYAAIGEMQAAVKQGLDPQRAYTFSMPIYVDEGGERAVYLHRVRVTVSDEAARVSLNHAPRELLVAMGLSAQEVSELRRHLPIPSVPSTEKRRWLGTVGELRGRGILTGQAYRRLDKDLFTVHAVRAHENATGFINLNSASPRVLSAIFAIDEVEARALAARRPFTSWEDAVAKTGREPTTFNVKPPAFNSRAMPESLALTSRCFRIRADVRIEEEGAVRRGMNSTVVAVVRFDERGNPAIRYWSEVPPEYLELDAAPPEARSDEGEKTTADTANLN